MTRLRRLLAWTVTPLLGLTVVTPLLAPAGAPASATPQEKPAAHHRPKSDHVKAGHGTHTWTTAERVVQVKTGPADNIALGIDTTLYVPDNASRKRPQPAILMTHGFGLTKDSAEVVSTARFFAAHGYVVLTFTSSGFGKSGGCVTLQSADYDVKSASQLIDQVLDPRQDVRHDKHGAVVGTIGGSYGGGIQLPLAAADKRIHASVVGRTWNDLRYSLDPNNRVVPGDPTGLTHSLNEQGVFKQQWTSLFYALGNTQPAMGGGGCPQAKQASADPVEIAAAAGCPGYYFSLCRTYTSLTSTGDADQESRTLIARASASTFIDQVRKPVLLVQGQSDTLFNLNDASATYLALKKRHVPVGMIWNSGGHGGYTVPAGRVRGLRRHAAPDEEDGPLLPLPAFAGLDGPLAAREEGRPRAGVHLLPRLDEVRRPRRERRAVRRQRAVPRARALGHVHVVGERRADRPGRRGHARLGDLRQPHRGQPGGVHRDLELHRARLVPEQW